MASQGGGSPSPALRRHNLRTFRLDRSPRLAHMPEFCVSRNPQPTGEHEVHAENCPAWPTDNVSLGWHRDCHGAVREARIYFPNVDGCAICSMQCHGR